MEDPFASLKLRFRDRCREQLAALEEIGRDSIDAPGPHREQSIKIAHSLAGAGGTFGFAGISERASHLEQILVTEGEPTSAKDAFDALVLELRRVTS